MIDTGSAADRLRAPFHELHVMTGARMVSLVGYAMPVHFPGGILQEYHRTRTQPGGGDNRRIRLGRLVRPRPFA